MHFTADDLSLACRRAAEAMRAAEEELNAADARLGDGDTGQTMRRMAERIQSAADPVEDLGVFFRKLGMAGASATGSSLGTLISIGLMEMSKGLQGKSSATLADLAAALKAAEMAMLARGGAGLGDKTALDILHGVRGSLEADPADPVAAVRAAASDTLETFRGLPCRIGRARMFSDRSVGVDDPGMLAFVRLVEALTPGSLKIAGVDSNNPQERTSR